MPDNLKRYHQQSTEFKDACWICEGWRPMEIKWNPGVSGEGNQDPVYAHFSYEGYKGRYLPKKDGFKTVRMVPPVPFSYLFNVDGSIICANDHDSKPYCEVDIEISVNNNKKHVKPESVNCKSKSTPYRVIDDEYKPVDEVLTLKIQPRIPDEIYIPPEVRIERAIWRFPISAFKEYKPDTQPLLDKCFEVDFEGTRIAKIVKNDEDVKVVRDMLYSIYRPLKDCYKHFAAIGAPSEIWSIPLNTYTEFCLTAGIIDGKLMKLSDFDRVFIATYTRTDKERNPRNPDRALVRYQFLEGLVRLSDQKYISNGLATTIPEALKMLLEENVKPYITKFDHQKWRVERYWNEDVDCVVKSYMPIFKGCYKKYSGLRTLPGQRKFMCLEEFNRLLTDMGLFNDNLGERDATLLFSLGMMTQLDELGSDRIYQMQFVEFLEAFARAVDKFSAAPFGKTEAEIPYEQRAEQPLNIKLEGTMLRMYEVCGADIKDIWVMPETSIYEMPETTGRVRYTTKKKKLVRVDPTEPNSADAYGV